MASSPSPKASTSPTRKSEPQTRAVPWLSCAQSVAASSPSATLRAGMTVGTPARRSFSARASGAKPRGLAIGTAQAAETSGTISFSAASTALSAQKPHTSATRRRMCMDWSAFRRARRASGLCPPSRKTGGESESSWHRPGHDTVRSASAKVFPARRQSRRVSVWSPFVTTRPRPTRRTG